MRMMRWIACWLAMLGAAGGLQAQDKAALDAATVQARIQALGMRDDTVPYEQQPTIW